MLGTIPWDGQLHDTQTLVVEGKTYLKIACKSTTNTEQMTTPFPSAMLIFI